MERTCQAGAGMPIRRQGSQREASPLRPALGASGAVLILMLRALGPGCPSAQPGSLPTTSVHRALGRLGIKWLLLFPQLLGNLYPLPPLPFVLWLSPSQRLLLSLSRADWEAGWFFPLIPAYLGAQSPAGFRNVAPPPSLRANCSTLFTLQPPFLPTIPQLALLLFGQLVRIEVYTQVCACPLFPEEGNHGRPSPLFLAPCFCSSL